MQIRSKINIKKSERNWEKIVNLLDVLQDKKINLNKNENRFLLFDFSLSLSLQNNV